MFEYLKLLLGIVGWPVSISLCIRSDDMSDKWRMGLQLLCGVGVGAVCVFASSWFTEKSPPMWIPIAVYVLLGIVTIIAYAVWDLTSDGQDD